MIILVPGGIILETRMVELFGDVFVRFFNFFDQDFVSILVIILVIPCDYPGTILVYLGVVPICASRLCCLTTVVWCVGQF